MGRPEVLRAYLEGEDPPEDPPLAVQGGALFVDGWWPAALRLEASTYLVRPAGEFSEPELGGELERALAASGLELMEGEWPLIEAITLQRLGWLGVGWQVWSASREEAEAAIAAAAVGEGTPDSPDAGEVARFASQSDLGSERGAWAPRRPDASDGPD